MHRLLSIFLLLGFGWTAHAQTDPLKESQLIEAIAAKNEKLCEALLEDWPPCALEKTNAPLLLDNTHPKNLQNLGKDDTGITALHIAAANGNTKLVEALLQAGADRFPQTRRYKCLPVELALENNHFETARVLMRAPKEAEDYRVEITLQEQKLTVRHKETQILTAEISSGRKGKPTQKGAFLIAEKDRDHRSNLYHNAPMPWFNRLSWTAAGIHQGNLPGYPASHGCIRTTNAAAKFIYNTCPIGTLVTIE